MQEIRTKSQKSSTPLSSLSQPQLSACTRPNFQKILSFGNKNFVCPHLQNLLPLVCNVQYKPPSLDCGRLLWTAPRNLIIQYARTLLVFFFLLERIKFTYFYFTSLIKNFMAIYIVFMFTLKLSSSRDIILPVLQ